MRALLVDDDSVDRLIMMRVFRESAPNIEFAEASDAQSMQTALGEHQFDLVLLDNRLACETAAEIIQQLHTEEHLSLPPIIVMSNAYEPDIAAACIEAGAIAFVEKVELNYEKTQDILAQCR